MFSIPKLPAWLAALIVYALDRATGRERDEGRKEANDAANAELEKQITAALAAATRADAANAAGGLRDNDGFRRD